MKMRFRKVLIAAGILTTWTYITYYFLLRNNSDYSLNNNNNKQRMTLTLQQLENNALGVYKTSTRLTQNVIDVMKVKFVFEDKTKETPIDIIALPPEHLLSIQQPPNVENADKIDNEQHLQQQQQQKEQEQDDVPLTLGPAITHLANGEPVIPILVFACNRISISKCLDNLLQYRPNSQQFPIIVSQDCSNEATKKVILSYKSQLTLMEQPDQSDIIVPPSERKFKGYYKISRHYGWALNTTFQHGFEFVVIVEDDLNVSSDFYEYFLATHVLLKKDPSLWCVSAWNDNGKADFIDTSQPELLYRTDFFPGLGWMLTKELWQELSVKWPKSFWDDWIRHPEQRKNRACIRPEVSRTRTFGKIGVSNGLFFDKYLKHIKLGEDFIKFTKLNLTYLLKDNYDQTFIKKVYTYPIVTYDELRRNLISKDGPVRIQYTSREQYKRITKMLGLMDDFRSGVPRTAYHGIVSFFYQKRRVYLAPNVNWKGYDLSWS